MVDDERAVAIAKLDNRICELKATIRDAESALGDLRSQLRGMYVEYAQLKYGVELGSIVICQGRRYKVTEIEGEWWCVKAWIKGSPQRKDGTFGTASRNLYDNWTVEEPQS